MERFVSINHKLEMLVAGRWNTPQLEIVRDLIAMVKKLMTNETLYQVEQKLWLYNSNALSGNTI